MDLDQDLDRGLDRDLDRALDRDLDREVLSGEDFLQGEQHLQVDL